MSTMSIINTSMARGGTEPNLMCTSISTSLFGTTIPIFPISITNIAMAEWARERLAPLP
jgi:hypothetical protein